MTIPMTIVIKNNHSLLFVHIYRSQVNNMYLVISPLAMSVLYLFHYGLVPYYNHWGYCTTIYELLRTYFASVLG